MQKKLTITIEEQLYAGLYNVVGKRKISKFIETLIRPHVIKPNLEIAYKEMAKDKMREQEALELAEATIGDSSNETW